MMRLMVMLLLVAGLAGLAGPAQARSDETLRLREGCAELVKIIDNREKARLLAAATTSLSEALRAGYCQGVLQEYLRGGAPCSGGTGTYDWFTVAKRIAAVGPERSTGSMDALLRSASCAR